MLLVLACTPPGDTSSIVEDTGIPDCDRVHDPNVLMYEDDLSTIHTPNEKASETLSTTGLAGPLGADVSWMLIRAGEVLTSSDGGCNWDETGGRLSSDGDWALYAAGTRVYAFDRTQASGGRSDDGGLSWDKFDPGEPFVGEPVVDPSNPDRVAGVQSRGVVFSDDAGDTWTVSGALQAGAAPAGGAVAPSDFDIAAYTEAGMVYWTASGGSDWTASVGEDWTETLGIAIHPDDAQTWFVQADTPDGLEFHRTTDGGSTWSRIASEGQVTMLGGEPIWPVPGDPTRFATWSYDTEKSGVRLYQVTAGVGSKSAFVGTYTHLNAVGFTAERWLAAVDAVP